MTSQNIVIIDTGCANLSSVRMAIERLGVTAQVSKEAAVIRGADKLILPGVGTAKAAMHNLQERGLVELIREAKQPLLGFCLGMQMLAQASEEHMGGESDIDCLGIVPGKVKLMQVGDLRLPHMGWNTLEPVRPSALTAGLEEGAQAYFVHGYAVDDPHNTVLASTHGARFSALVQHGHVAGMQFHPERSSAVGRKLLINFLEWSP